MSYEHHEILQQALGDLQKALEVTLQALQCHEAAIRATAQAFGGNYGARILAALEAPQALTPATAVYPGLALELGVQHFPPDWLLSSAAGHVVAFHIPTGELMRLPDERCPIVVCNWPASSRVAADGSTGFPKPTEATTDE